MAWARWARPGVSPLGFGATVEMPGAPIPGLLSVDFRGYDLLPDGRIVSVSSALGDGTSGGPFSSEARVIRVALNWFEELKRLAPAK